MRHQSHAHGVGTHGIEVRRAIVERSTPHRVGGRPISVLDPAIVARRRHFRQRHEGLLVELVVEHRGDAVVDVECGHPLEWTRDGSSLVDCVALESVARGVVLLRMVVPRQQHRAVLRRHLDRRRVGRWRDIEVDIERRLRAFIEELHQRHAGDAIDALAHDDAHHDLLRIAGRHRERPGAEH